MSFTAQLPIRKSRKRRDKAVTIEGRSAFASELEKIAARMVAAKDSTEDGTRLQRFIDFFSVTPVRDKVGWRR